MKAPKIPTELLWDLTFLFTTVAFVYFTTIFLFRNKISKKSRVASELRTKISPMISKFIFHDDDASKEEKVTYIDLKVKMRDMLQDDFTRKVVSQIVLDLRKDVSGSAQDRLFELFKDLDLHKESYKKLKSWRWERVSKGIWELTQMEVGDAYEIIAKYVNDRRSIIRKQAEIGIVALNDKGIGHFLDTTRYKISEWQQLKLMGVLSNKTAFTPPSFKAWLTSTNKFVVLFALRLIKYYAQNDAEASILELVKHEDNQIKAGAIDCIRAFNFVAALPTLKKIFWACSTDIKIAILDTIGAMGTVNDFVFLNSIEKKEYNYSVTNKALSAMNAIKPESILPTKGITDLEEIKVPEDIIEPSATPLENTVGEAGIEEHEVQLSQEMEEQTPPLETAVPNAEAGQHDFESHEPVKHTFSMDFIPLVVETNRDKKPRKKSETMNTTLKELNVIFEEVSSRYDPNKKGVAHKNIKDLEVIASDLHFLPIVVPNQEEENDLKDLEDIPVNFEVVVAKPFIINNVADVDLGAIWVDYEEVKGIPTHRSVEKIPVVFEEVLPSEKEIPTVFERPASEHFEMEVVFDNGAPPLRIPEMTPPELLDIEVDVEEINSAYTSLSEIVVVAEQVTGTERLEEDENDLPLWLLEEIANETNGDTDDGGLTINGPEWDAKADAMMAKIKSYFEHIPETEYQDLEVSETTELLDNLSLFGDEREIPLLQELMEQEKQAANRKRIDALLKRFTGNDAYGFSPADSPAYSVFEELFRNCDLESKLILLDEIVLIGDDKEIHFLEQLTGDPNQTIREKAKTSLNLMKERSERIAAGLEKKDADEYERFLNMMELNPPKKSDLFNINFEISLDDREEVGMPRETGKETGGFTAYISDLWNRLTK